MNAIRTHLTEDEAASLEAMSQRVMRGLSEVAQAICDACENQPSLQMKAAVTSYLAHHAGQMIARAEFIALNAGGTENAVHALCGGAFNDGRNDAYAEEIKAGRLKIANAPTTGATQ